jgi:radical SAM superfamily enzyme YgiQ (UPF0313 family)
MYIAAVLRDNGHTVEIYDALLDILHPQTKNVDGTVHVGIDWETVEHDLKIKAPDIIGISCLFTTQRPDTLKMSHVSKRATDALIIVGGSDPSVNFKDILNTTSSIDIVCRGEGEFTVLAIANAFLEGLDFMSLPGTVVKLPDGSIQENEVRPPIENLDSLPFPAYELVNVEHYITLNGRGYGGRPALRYPGSERALSLITSRGCPYNCVFCSIHLHMGKKWRPHSSQYIGRHIEYIIKQFAIRHIHFEDDNLTVDLNRCAAICSHMERLKPSITWDTPNGVRIDRLTRELLLLFKKSGCIYIILAVESGVQSTLTEIIGKQMDLQCVPQVAHWCREIGIDALSFFIIGFPGETVETMNETVDYALHLWQRFGISPTVFIATPLIGTRLYTQCQQHGFLTTTLSSEALAVSTAKGGSHVLIETPEFKSRDIDAVMHQFVRGYKRIFILNLVRFFFFQSPGTTLSSIRFLWHMKTKMSLKELLLQALTYRYSIARLTQLAR